MQKINMDFSKQIVLSFNNVVNTIMNGFIYIRIKGKQPSQIPFSFADATGATYHIPIEQNFEGEIESVQVILSNLGIEDGACFCKVAVFQGSYLISEPEIVLISNYLTTNTQLSYPYSEKKNMNDSKGMLSKIPPVEYYVISDNLQHDLQTYSLYFDNTAGVVGQLWIRFYINYPYPMNLIVAVPYNITVGINYITMSKTCVNSNLVVAGLGNLITCSLPELTLVGNDEIYIEYTAGVVLGSLNGNIISRLKPYEGLIS